MPAGNSKKINRQGPDTDHGPPDLPRASGQELESSVTDDCQGVPRPSSVRSQAFTFNAVGQVESVSGGDDPHDTSQEKSLIVLRPELADGLDGIVPGDRLVVIFVFDRASGYDLRQHPRGNRHRALRGVFALRSPRRPNPIGVTGVEVMSIFDNVLAVRGLDAWPGTPILDLKPEVKEER